MTLSPRRAISSAMASLRRLPAGPAGPAGGRGEAALRALEERRDRAESQRRFGDRLAAASGVDEVSAVALGGLADQAGADMGALYLAGEDPGSFPAAARRGVGPLAPVVPGEGLAGRALAERRAVLAAYDGTTLRLTALAGTVTARREAHLPLLHGDRPVGVVSLGRAGDVPFSGPDLEILRDLAGQAAVVCAEALSVRQVERVARRLDAVLSATDEGILAVDLHGRTTVVNRAALAMTGYRREELIGHGAHGLIHHTRPDGAAYPAAECPIVATVREGAGCRTSDDVYWRRDGTAFPVEYSASPLREEGRLVGAVVTFTDIGDRRRAESQREAVHALTRALAEAPTLVEAGQRALDASCDELQLPVAIAWTPTSDGTQLTVTGWHAAPGYERLADRLRASPLTIGTGPAGLALVRGAPVFFRDLARDPPRPDMTAVQPLTSALAIPGLGSAGVVSVAEFFAGRDLSVEEGLLDTMATMASIITQFQERARVKAEAEHAKDEFVATVAHELRSPLTAIRGWLDVLLEEEQGQLTEGQRRTLATILRSTDRIGRLAEDLTTARKIESGELGLVLAEVDMSEVVADTVALMSAQAADKGVHLALDAPGPVRVRGDRARLAQLIGNLVMNAVKFTPADGQARVSVSAAAGLCRVRVTDTGIGIPPPERGRLFERFYRAPSAAARDIEGTGLGLAISKAIAEGHGGRIYLADREGPGSEFVVEMPLLEGTAPR